MKRDMDFIKTIVKKFAFLLVLLGCQLQAETPEHIKVADRLTYEFVTQVAQDYDLHCYGSGGAMATEIKSIALSLWTNKELNAEDFRELVVRLTETFLKKINQCENIDLYLAKYPATHYNIDIIIESTKKKVSSSDEVYQCFKTKNKLRYCKCYDAEKRDIETLYTETYEEALAIVQAQNPGVDLAARPTKEQAQKWKSEKVKTNWPAFLKLLLR